MAARWEDDLQGYDVSRFEGEVREDLLCSICQEVPKDPRLCQHRDHLFCFAHISRHLIQNSRTCPVCRDPLTPETLRRPTGFLKNYLEDLKIKCDHHDRGCPDLVRLENIQSHVEKCEYAPVMCGNEGCETVVNRRDEKIHQKNLCQFRIAKCHDCRDIRESQDEMKASQDEMKEKVRKMERKQDDINDKMTRMKQSVDEMRQEFEKMMVMVNQALQGSNLNNNGAQAIDPAVPADNQDITIVGGRYGPGNDAVLNTVEKFNIVEGKSTQLPRLNHPRAQSASCVYNNDVVVVGGFDGQDGTDTIEVLKMNQHPLRWTMLDGKLPVKLSGHVVRVYQGKLYIIGGYNWNEKKTSDAIHAIDLTPPYTSKLLARMPQPSIYHRAELVDGKLFILGGSTTGYNKDAIDSVVVYDLIKNEFKPCPSLPQPVCRMSTVTWGNMIIVVGGADKNGQDLNDVLMYDTETGRSERLPSLIYKRRGCSAVIMHDVIVVLGGWNIEQGYLNTVETFTMGDDGWKEQPGMKEKRLCASAVVNLAPGENFLY